MGNQRDWSQEREKPDRERDSETTWSILSNPEEIELPSYTTPPPNYYVPGMMERDAERLLKRYPFPPGYEQRSSPQNQDISASNEQLDRPTPKQSRQKKGFWDRLFNRGNQNPPPQENETSAVGNFKQKLKTSAQTELNQNQQQLNGLREQYTGRGSKPALDNLRTEVELIAQYEEKEREIQEQLSWVSNNQAAAAINSQAYDPEAFKRLQNDLKEVKSVSAALLKQFPVAGLLRAEQVDRDTISDAQLQKVLSGKFNGIERDIERSRERIDNGDIPLTELDGIIPGVIEQLPENKRQEVQQYIKQKKHSLAKVSAAAAGAEVLLTLFGVFSGGGILSGIYYGTAAALGLSTAAYEFEKADDLNTIGNAQKVGGAEQLLSDPDSARRSYVFAWANLTLGLIDSGLAIAEGGKLLQGAKAAEVLASRPGAKALYTVPRNKVLEIQRAVDLERAGDPAAGQTLAVLKQELGSDFDAVYDTLSSGNLRVIDDAEAATIKGKGLSGLTPEQDAIAEQLGNEFAQTIIERGQQAKYQKDKIDYIRQKLDSGKLVEEIGESRVRDYYSDPNANVWKNVYLQVKDAAGNDLGGQQSELDFFVHYTDGSSPTEIVSAKLNGKKVQPGRDLGNFSNFYDSNISGTQDNLAKDLNARFSKPGETHIYDNAANIVVRYTDVKTGKTGEIFLSEFRNKIPKSKTPGTDKYSTKVLGLAPNDTTTKKGTEYIKLGIEKKDLFNKIINIIDSNIVE